LYHQSKTIDNQLFKKYFKTIKRNLIMKKVSIIIVLIALNSVSIFAQNEKMQMALGKTLGQFATAKNADDYKNTANVFARIANAEPTEWLPQYYAAQSHVLAGYELMESNMTEAQELAKMALNEIKAAQKIAPMETELMVLEAFTYQLQLLENAMTNGQKYAPMIFATLGKAEAINPENPRIYSIRGEFTLNMPEFYGGGVAKATPDIKKAAEKFGTFKPASPVHPNWGKERTESLVKRVEKTEGSKG
jgi:hypothetical protein